MSKKSEIRTLHQIVQLVNSINKHGTKSIGFHQQYVQPTPSNMGYLFRLAQDYGWLTYTSTKAISDDRPDVEEGCAKPYPCGDKWLCWNLTADVLRNPSATQEADALAYRRFIQARDRAAKAKVVSEYSNVHGKQAALRNFDISRRMLYYYLAETKPAVAATVVPKDIKQEMPAVFYRNDKKTANITYSTADLAAHGINPEVFQGMDEQQVKFFLETRGVQHAQ